MWLHGGFFYGEILRDSIVRKINFKDKKALKMVCDERKILAVPAFFCIFDALSYININLIIKYKYAYNSQHFK